MENLQEEIKRLKSLNKNTIKIRINFDEQYYEVDTQIPAKLKEMNYYYLADDYKNPTKVQFIEYGIAPSIENRIIIYAIVSNLKKDKTEYYFEKSLFKSKSEAGDFYIMNKYK